MIKRILINIHRVLGLLLCLLFLMWFLSGFVMIYHSFPRVSSQERLSKQKVISGNLQSLEDLKSALPDTARIQQLSLDMYLGRPTLHLHGKNLPTGIYADTLVDVAPVTYADIQKIAQQWNSASITRVDTLWKSDQWLMPRRLGDDVPVYKYIFADELKHELYISAQSGNVLQYTNKDQRLWAWLGAIPHWIYFTSLRQNQPLWSSFIKWTSGIGAIMCLVGMILGIRILLKSRKKKFKSPFRKRWYKWHYISGLIFGIFAITFAFSGLMSMMDLPDWMKKKSKSSGQEVTKPGRRGGPGINEGGSVDIGTYVLDYRLLVNNIENIKKVEWATFQKQPYYKVTTDDKVLNIDASDSIEIRSIAITEEIVHRAIKIAHGNSVEYTVELLQEYDDEYYSRKNRSASLPVYRVIVNDELHTRYYYNPETLSQQRTDDNSRLRGILYGGLHSLNFKFLTDRPILWNIVMFTLLIGGTFLSVTGVVLSVKWIVRKTRKMFNKYKNKKK